MKKSSGTPSSTASFYCQWNETFASTPHNALFVECPRFTILSHNPEEILLSSTDDCFKWLPGTFKKPSMVLMRHNTCLNGRDHFCKSNKKEEEVWIYSLPFTWNLKVIYNLLPFLFPQQIPCDVDGAERVLREHL